VTEIRSTRWTKQHIDQLSEAPATTVPSVVSTLPRVLAHHDVWDPWPVQDTDGRPVVIGGEELWMALSAPAVGHPEHRHDQARIRLLAGQAEAGNRWRDLGPVFAEGVPLGSRQWSGSAVRRPDGTISIFYTATGRRGEARPTFRQRVAEARVRILTDRGRIQLDQQVDHREILRSDGCIYLPADEIGGAPGRIRAFRDPAWFRDPSGGQEYLLIAASVPGNGHFMGAVALARAAGDGWTLLPPLLVADGINHEIELPHIVVYDTRYYLFFTTTRRAFHPRGCAPTGLYGFMAPDLCGPYQPINRSGLVLQNPASQPDVAYAWHVLPDLRVASFLNYLPGSEPRNATAAEARARFGGTLVPTLNITLAGARAFAGESLGDSART
jgi:levansucrase